MKYEKGILINIIMPFREITFENMIASFAPIIANKYKDTWGIHNDVKSYKLDDPLGHEQHMQGCLYAIRKIYTKSFADYIIDHFKSIQSSTQNKDFCVNMSIIEGTDGYLSEPLITRFHDTNKLIIRLHALKNWKSYQICYVELEGDDKKILQDAIEYTILRIGNQIHMCGVNSQKHNENVMLYQRSCGYMFKAMIYENMLEELYNALYSEYEKID